MDPVQLELKHQLGSWSPLITVWAAYVAIVVGLFVRGRGPITLDPRTWAVRIGDSLERLTRIPGWAAAMVGTATFGLLVAGIGFYSDVRWHVSLGRDDVLFTAPHTMIVIGLATILGAAFIGEFFATATKAKLEGGGLRILGMRIPRSALAMGIIGFCAMSGFPMDELWHRAYGIDVTMWSPTHLLMICGAVISPLASWMALGEAGVRPESGAWATGVHVAVGSFALLGLNALQGEFAFGVPQFQQLYHPVMYALAAGFALTAITLVTRWWPAPLIVAGVGVMLFISDSFTSATSSQPRAASLYIVAGIAVAIVGRVFGTERRGRFAVASGIAVGTVGLAAEWWWSQGSHQPWNASLLPEAPILAVIVGVAAGTLGVAFAAAIRREPIGLQGPVLAVAGLAILAGLAIPLPRTGLDARADLTVTNASKGEVSVTAKVTPADAADDAHWFQLLAWQGGGLESADMVPTGTPGEYRSEHAVPAHDDWKTTLRLHRGASMVAIPVWMPADPEIDAPQVSAVDKSEPFLTEQRYLLREQNGVNGSAWFAIGVYLVLAAIAAMWVLALVFTGRSITRDIGVAAPA